MADKQIVELPHLPAVTDETQIPVYQPGAAEPAQRMSGKQFKEFGESAVVVHVQRAVDAAAAAQGAYEGVRAALDNLPEGDTLIINDLTTGGTKAALSAEQGKILAQRPNPNLLDNWYFADPINQRGQTEYLPTSGLSYAIDRWYLSNAGMRLSLNPGYARLTGVTTTGYAYTGHRVDNDYSGKTVTLSAVVRGSVDAYMRLRLTARNPSITYAQMQFKLSGGWDIVAITADIPADSPELQALIYPDTTTSGNALDIACAKKSLFTTTGVPRTSKI